MEFKFDGTVEEASKSVSTHCIAVFEPLFSSLSPSLLPFLVP